MLTVRLDKETDEHLNDILLRERITRSELVKRLINEHWRKVQPGQSVLDRRGGMPIFQISAAADLSDRERRKLAVAARMHTRHR